MNLKRSTPPVESGTQILVMDGFMSWREESDAVSTSYQRWRSAVGNEREPADHAYVAALDREEQAASAYRRLIERVGTT